MAENTETISQQPLATEIRSADYLLIERDDNGDNESVRIGEMVQGAEVTTATGTQTVVQALDQRGPVFDSVADMKAASGLTVGVKCRTLGYYEPGDGGGNDYEIVAAGTGTDDGGSFIDLAGSGLQAKGLFCVFFLNPRQFGSHANGVDDDTAGVQACINYGLTPNTPQKYIKMGAGNWMLDGVEILGDGIWIDGSGPSATKITYTNVSGTAAAFSYGQSKTGSGELIPVSNCKLSNMFIDGNRDGGAIGSAVRTTVFDGFELDNVHTKDCKGNYGFAIVGTGAEPRNDLLVKNCSAYRCGADGLDIKAGAHKIIVDGFYTADHLDETVGDSVGIDIRGQRISLNHIYAKNCIEIGVRVRTNVGVQQDASWDFTKDAQVSISNCFAFECRDGFDLTAPLDSHIAASNLHTMDCTRYGIASGGDGSVTVSGGSSLRDLIGIKGSNNPNHVVTYVGYSVRNPGQDGVDLSGASINAFSFIGGLIEGAERYGVQIISAPDTANLLFNGTTIRNNFTNIAVVSSDAKGAATFRDCVIEGASSRGIQISTSSEIAMIFEGGRLSGNATNIHSSNSNTVFRGVNGVVSQQILEQNIAIDATGQVNIGFAHNLWKAPSAENVTIKYARVTNVADFSIGYERVAGISGSLLNVEVSRSSASATAGAEIKVVCKVDLE